MKKRLTIGNALLLLTIALIAQPLVVTADHQPADKVVAAGSALNRFDRSIVLLQERMKVSSTSDLMLQLTAECSIITELVIGGNGAEDASSAFGQIEVWITLDGDRVPVSTLDDHDEDKEGVQTDDGSIILCNRTYSRSVRDRETPGDGTDEENSFIRTRQANGFNWLALDVGKVYDDQENGNNIVDVVVHAEYETTETGRAAADAFVGRRTLIVEPTHASVHEQVQPVEPTPTPTS